MNVDLNGTAIIKFLTGLAVPLLDDARKNKTTPGIPTSIGPLLPAGEYVVQSFLTAGEVLTACNQLDYSAAYVSQFRTTAKLKKIGVNRFRHIIYHLENHSIRVRMIFDRTLQLVNVVFRLGNSERNCTRQVILQNDHVKGSDVIKPIKELDQVLQKYKPTANVVLHQRGHFEPVLKLPELISLLEEAGVPDLPTHAAKAEMDNFVVTKEKELLQFNEMLFETVAWLLNELGPECERVHSELASGS